MHALLCGKHNKYKNKKKNLIQKKKSEKNGNAATQQRAPPPLLPSVSVRERARVSVSVSVHCWQMPAARFSSLLVSSLLCVAAQPPTVTTTGGKVSGEVDALPLTGEPVYRWGGIPYAAPPVGALRFRPPAPVVPWPGVLNGSLPQRMCVQPSGAGDEDCLCVTVAAPPGAAGNASSLLPVLVYFHGGNLISGSPPISEMEVLAVKSNVVTVNVAYRLNLLGFLATRELAAEPGWVGNQGIADAIAALRWVRDNAAAFGGDASRVTLMGQSSGGTLILALYCAPSAAGLFAGAISLSGSPNITQNAAAKQAQDAPIIASLNCSAATPAATVACLRALPAYTLARAMPSPWNTPGIFGWSLPAGIPVPPAGEGYAGIVHIDGALLTLPLDQALAAETVPAALIISNMAAEGDGGSGIGVRNASAAAWQAALLASFPASSWGTAAGPAAAAAVGAAYAAEAAVDPDLAYASINSDYGLTCAARSLAAAVAATGVRRKTPLYVLYNAWPRSAPSANGNGRWPYHGLDLTEMGWGWQAPNATDLAAASLLQGLVADFCYNRGVMPARWAWPAVAPGEPLSTLVVAQEGGYPGGGTRAVQGWKNAQCTALYSVSLATQGYWWCD